MNGPRAQNVRLTGTLVSFNSKPGRSEANIRVGDVVLHAPKSARGVLEPGGTINREINGRRYDPIDADEKIALEVNYDSNGENPIVAAWAPASSRSTKP